MSEADSQAARAKKRSAASDERPQEATSATSPPELLPGLAEILAA